MGHRRTADPVGLAARDGAPIHPAPRRECSNFLLLGAPKICQTSEAYQRASASAHLVIWSPGQFWDTEDRETWPRSPSAQAVSGRSRFAARAGRRSRQRSRLGNTPRIGRTASRARWRQATSWTAPPGTGPLGDLVRLYLKEVTDKRPGQQSRIAERSRLERFLREEKELSTYAVANLTPEHFEDYRDRRLAQTSRSGKKLSPGTVKRELTLLKHVLEFRKKRLGLLINPVNTEDVARLAVNDERDVRLSDEERDRLLQVSEGARNPWLRPIVELGF